MQISYQAAVALDSIMEGNDGNADGAVQSQSYPEFPWVMKTALKTKTNKWRYFLTAIPVIAISRRYCNRNSP